jgi:hypothetical protein
MNAPKDCGKPGCSPMQQVRGKMAPEDHHMQHLRLVEGTEFRDKHGVFLPIGDWERDVYDQEEPNMESLYDVRVSCSKCGKTTDWLCPDRIEYKRFGDGDNRRQVIERDAFPDIAVNQWNDMMDGKPKPVPVKVSRISTLFQVK